MPSLKVVANRFELHGLAGAGGMGTIFRARDRRTGLWVALKLMNVEGRSWQETERFSREADILAELRHPGIVSYITHGRVEEPAGPSHGSGGSGSGNAEGRMYLVMEWLDGESLASRLSAGLLSVPDSMLLLRRIADALSVAHQRGIVHRDIKPSNLFLRGGQIGQVTLLDFGIARRRTRGQSLTTSLSVTQGGEVLGTPEYMSPEQARGAVDIGPAADIFSLGCVMYQCLTGQPPFPAGTPAAALAKILLQTPKPIFEMRKGVPESVSALVARMLIKDPAKRPADAETLLQELASVGPLPLRERSSGSFAIISASGPPATAEAEQRLFCVVLSMPPPGMDKKDKRMILARDLGRYGAQVEWLLDESLLVTCTGEGSAIDQAARAGRCALLLKEQWPDSEVVLATGRGVAMGQIPMGEVIDRAAQLLTARLAHVTLHGEQGQSGVWLDELSAGLLSRHFTVSRDPRGWMLLSEPRSLDQTEPLLGKPTPCVGREPELFALEALLSGCIDGQRGCGLLILGPPGMGKSRLRREFVRRWQSKPAPNQLEIIFGQGEQLSANTPYKLLASILRRLCALTGKEPLETQQFRLSRRLGQNLPASANPQRTIELLGELCGVPFAGRRPNQSGAAPPPGSPESWQRQSELVQAFIQFVRAECQVKPQLWIIEDLQWVDAMSLEAIEAALRFVTDRPFLVMALARPEVREIFPRPRLERFQEISLSGLPRKACEYLVRGALPAQVPQELVTRIIEQAGGNALFIEEMVRAIAEGKRDTIPETVLAMLQARLARLPAESRRVLRLASVCGQTFRLADLKMFLASEMDNRSLKACLEALLSSELLEVQRDGEGDGQDQFRFRHALVKDAAYGTLSVDDRIHAHCMAAQHLDRHGGAAAHYRQALTALATLPDNAQRRRRYAELLVQLVRTTRGREPVDQNLERLTRAEELLRRSPEAGQQREPTLETHIRYWFGILHYDNNQLKQAISDFEAVIERNTGDPHDESLVLLPATLLGRIYLMQGHFGRGLWMLERLNPLLKEDPESLDPQIIASIAFLAFGYAVMGNLRRAREVAHRAMEIAVLRDEPVLRAVASGASAMVWLQAGQLPRSVQESRAGIVAAEQAGNFLYLYMCSVVCAWALTRMGQHENAAEEMARAVRVSKQLGGQVLWSDTILLVRAEMAYHRGQPAEALALAEQSVQVSAQCGGVYCSALAHRIWAQSLCGLGNSNWDEVAQHLSKSLDGLTAGQAVIEAARTHAVWGNLCCMYGRDAEARRHLQAACERFTQAGLDAELASVQAALRTIPDESGDAPPRPRV